MRKIIVDDRERNERLLSILEKESGTSIEFKRLIVGDYLLDNLLVERKTYSDFCDSIKNGRIFHQAGELSHSKVQPLIIVEFPPMGLKQSILKIEAIQGAFITLSILYAIPLIRSRSPEESARLMLQASRQIENFGLRDHCWKRPQPSKNSKSVKRKMQVHLLQGFPGIGLKRANQLLEKFGSIRKIISLTPDELRKIDGFGDKLIRDILDLID